MKFASFKTVSKAVLAAALTTAGISIQAGEVTGNLNVSANVQATCVIDSVAPLAFGNYVQGVGPVDAAALIDLNCGIGVLYNVRLSGLAGSAPRTMSQGASTLQYQLYRDAARTQLWGQTDNTDTVDGTGTGASVPLSVYGRIPDSGANQLAASGAYTAVVTVTVAY
jgi:spore coat protein U-like protein